MIWLDEKGYFQSYIVKGSRLEQKGIGTKVQQVLKLQ